VDASTSENISESSENTDNSEKTKEAKASAYQAVASRVVERLLLGIAPKPDEDALTAKSAVPEHAEAAVPNTAAPSAQQSLDIRRIVEWSAFGVGAGFITAGIVEGIRFISLNRDLDTARSNVDSRISDVCAASPPTVATVNACSRLQQTNDARTLEIVFLTVGAIAAGTGAVLYFTEPAAPPKTTTTQLHVVPRLSHTSAGMDVQITF